MVQRGKSGNTEPVSHGDQAGVGAAERDVGVLVDQLRNSSSAVATKMPADGSDSRTPPARRVAGRQHA